MPRLLTYSRKTYSTLFIVLAVMLMLLPFINALQDILTRVVMSFKIYRAIQEFVVPHELKVIETVLNFLGIDAKSGNAYIMYVRNLRPEVIFLVWNCVGWQSFLFLIVTLFSGLAGNFTKMSKLEVFLVGIIGTYIVNIFRLVLVVVMYYLTGRGVGLVFHNYFSNLLSILWLFVFWWIAYTYVLVEKADPKSA